MRSTSNGGAFHGNSFHNTSMTGGSHNGSWRGSGWHGNTWHNGFHNGFHHRFFAFGGPGYISGYPYDDYGVDGGCLRRVWGPYGWRMINVCY